MIHEEKSELLSSRHTAGARVAEPHAAGCYLTGDAKPPQ